ncbi:unnamed protein product [Sphenostylis stenocarpa]|uniref:Uncharacterized protein n=1 Tax=Sphenostylis stenocarpa TaxID=92480 RepID=A0AA86VFY8_9FABA|nr:unnamed protein product [Sphenostylis stenocarpa]
MAEVPETNPPPPDPPIPSAPDVAEETAPPATATASQPSTDIVAPPALAPKRQRRPSVRLGEIGDQRAAVRRRTRLEIQTEQQQNTTKILKVSYPRLRKNKKRLNVDCHASHREEKEKLAYTVN